VRTVDLKVEDVAFGGKGVARENGKAVFIPYTIESEVVSAKIMREKNRFAEAELVELHKASPHRVKPVCLYFGRCGGCVYQHIDYAHQLEIKSRQVFDVLKRIGKFEKAPMRPIIPSPHHYTYRNRITVHAEDGVIGYFRRDSHRLIDIERCPIAMDEVNDELARLRASKPRDGHYTLRANRDRLLRKRPATGLKNHFTQTNDAVANALRDLVVGLVPAGQELLIDAYCGAGFFAKALADKFERVVGIDRDRFAIARAKEDATAKETYIAGDVEDELGELEGAVHRTAREFQSAPASFGRLGSIAPTFDRDRTTIIVDPPATGLSAGIRNSIIDLAPETFLYVSCNPATLARDLAHLQRGFKIESITPLDMFPQTAEIEVLAHLRPTRRF
jgi:23S rRNA (uracil1939-C5)-methyltransferase